MKKGVVILLHVGYWFFYCVLLLLFYFFIAAGMQNMKRQSEGIGVHFTDDHGPLEVEKIYPDGPSDKQGELKEGDIVLKVGQEGAEDVDIANLKPEEIKRLVKGKTGTAVRLTVKKKDQSIKVINIVRGPFWVTNEAS